MNNDKKPVWFLTIHFKGKAPRDRKIKNHRIEVGEMPDKNTELTINEISFSLGDTLETDLQRITSYKEVSQILLVACPGEIQELPQSMSINGEKPMMKSQMLFDPRQMSWKFEANEWLSTKKAVAI